MANFSARVQNKKCSSRFKIKLIVQSIHKDYVLKLDLSPHLSQLFVEKGKYKNQIQYWP